METLTLKEWGNKEFTHLTMFRPFRTAFFHKVIQAKSKQQLLNASKSTVHNENI